MFGAPRYPLRLATVLTGTGTFLRISPPRLRISSTGTTGSRLDVRTLVLGSNSISKFNRNLGRTRLGIRYCSPRDFHSTLPARLGVGLDNNVPRKLNLMISDWMWFRKDGRPRSKLKGVFFTLWALITIVLCRMKVEIILPGQFTSSKRDSKDHDSSGLQNVELRKLLNVLELLLCTTQIQRIDFDSYSSVSWDSYTSTLSHFENICKVTYLADEHGEARKKAAAAHDGFFHMLRGFDDSESSTIPIPRAKQVEVRDTLHGIMRNASEHVHDLLHITVTMGDATFEDVLKEQLEVPQIVLRAALEILAVVKAVNDLELEGTEVDLEIIG